MDDKKPDNVDEFEEEIVEREFKDPTPHFDDEIEYLSDQSGQSKNLMGRFKNLPRFSVGWLGLLLIILVVLFLFLPKGSKNLNNEELIILKSRVEDLEARENTPEIFEQKLEKLESDMLKGIQVSDRLDQLEGLLVAKINTLEKDVKDLKTQVEEAKKINAARAAATPAPKTVKPRVKKPVQTSSVKYHTVKKGENVYRIALKYNLTEPQLLELNNLEKGALIFPGQKLKVSK